MRNESIYDFYGDRSDEENENTEVELDETQESKEAK
jgi:hypothetical protein